MMVNQTSIERKKNLEKEDMKLSFFCSNIKAGFPSPAEDFIDCQIDLNSYLIDNPTSTFLVRVSGTSMVDVGILSGDILIVDKSVPISEGQIVVASVDGEFTVKRLQKRGGTLFLVAANKNFKPIEIRQGDEFQIWGVVKHAIHSFNKQGGMAMN